MVTARLVSLRPAPWVCQSCQRHLRHARQTVHPPVATTQKRTITRKYQARTKDAEEQWQERYAEIRNGQRQSMLDILQERGFLNAVAGYVASPLQFIVAFAHPRAAVRNRI